MAEFVYNNAKNTTTGYRPVELNYGYHLKISLEKNINLCS